MTKKEFETLLGRAVNEEDYKKIEFVYTFHPSIGEMCGKQQIVALYDLGGMRVISDMLPTAQKAQKLEDAMREKRLELERLEDEYKALKRGEL